MAGVWNYLEASLIHMCGTSTAGIKVPPRAVDQKRSSALGLSLAIGFQEKKNQREIMWRVSTTKEKVRIYMGFI